MDLTIDNIILVSSILLFISIVAGKASYRLGVPTLVLFLLIGILSGSEGIGGIYFDHPKPAQFVGIIALNFILFSGGFETDWQATRKVFWQGFSLATGGVVLTALSVGAFVWIISDFSLVEGMLLGAVISSTDAAAVFSILRSKNLALKNDLRQTLELESGSNDPMAYFLTIAFLGILQDPATSVVSFLLLLFKQFLIGGIAGYLSGRLSRYVVNNLKLDFEGLYPVLIMALVFITFSATDSLGGNGFLAVYLSAVYLGNHSLVHKKNILRFFDGVAWLMQITLFLVLGLLVYPSDLLRVVGLGLAVSLFLMFAARPLSVFISLLPFRMKLRRRLYISWVGLRGAVPIVFATYPLIAGVEKASIIFNVVFFVSVISVLIQGTTLTLVARWLKLLLPMEAKRKTASDLLLADDTKSELYEIQLEKNHPVIGRQISELNFPNNALIAMMKRNDRFLTPKGNTMFQAGDQLIIISEDSEGVEKVKMVLNAEKK